MKRIIVIILSLATISGIMHASAAQVTDAKKSAESAHAESPDQDLISRYMQSSPSPVNFLQDYTQGLLQKIKENDSRPSTPTHKSATRRISPLTIQIERDRSAFKRRSAARPIPATFSPLLSPELTEAEKLEKRAIRIARIRRVIRAMKARELALETVAHKPKVTVLKPTPNMRSISKANVDKTNG